MTRLELISYLDGGIEGLRELSSRQIHSDNEIRIGHKFFRPQVLEKLLSDLEDLSFHVGNEPDTK